MIVVGTAGHIDHGKSAIVRRLTGTDPDRLPDEKRRGMTIDLGFAFRTTRSGDVLGFVDVPGHERFVRTMIAGAGGIDVVLLVIAADDGWMPQSQEHFDILQLLGHRTGAIVINKSDLAKDDWLTLLADDVRQRVAGTFLESAPIFTVSAVTGDGFDALSDWLDQLPALHTHVPSARHTRLAIDRVFVQSGIGRVVTGTLRGGPLSVGDTITVWPSLTSGRIRTIQSHNEAQTTAQPGARTALSFSGVDGAELVRGGVVTTREDLSYFSRRPVLALRTTLLSSSPIPLQDRREVELLHATTSVRAEVRLFGAKELLPGQQDLVFVQPTAPLFAPIGDPVIIRLPTPMMTLGGATIVGHLARFPKRREHAQMTWLTHKGELTARQLIASTLDRLLFVPQTELLSNTDVPEDQTQETLKAMLAEGVVTTHVGYVACQERLERTTDLAVAVLRAAVDSNGSATRQALPRLADDLMLSNDETAVLVDYLVSRNRVRRDGEWVTLSTATDNLPSAVAKARDQIRKQLTESALAPPPLKSFADRGKAWQEAIRILIENGDVIKVGSEFVFPASTWRAFVSFVQDHLHQHDQMAVTEFRDHFAITRKHVIPVLEEMDRRRITRREGNLRKAGSEL